MTISNSGDIVKRLEAMEKALTGKDLKERLQQVGEAMKPIAHKAAAQDLGSDAAFSGWRNKAGGVMPLNVAYTIDPAGKSVTIHRDRFSAGPWRVAQSGRNADGGVGAFQGPGINLRTGRTARRKDGSLRANAGRVARSRQRRWNGRTEGKGTWDKAAEAMSHEAPKRLTTANRAAIAKAFRGG